MTGADIDLRRKVSGIVERRWQRGETVMVRYAGGRFADADPRHRGTVFGSPHVVVEDSDDAIALYQPEGTTLVIWDLAEERVRERLVTWMEFLRLLFPGRAYAVALVFETGSGVPPWYALYFGGEGRFRG
jgi:hypothetical protein